MRYLSINVSGGDTGGITAPGGVPTGGTSTLVKILGVGINYLFIAAIILGLIFLVWGGIDWIMSEGNKQKLDQARQKVIFAIIGLVVVFIAFFIVNAISGVFGVKP